MIKKNKDKERAIQEGIFKILAVKNLIRRNQEAQETEEERNESDENTQSSTWSMTELSGKTTKKTVHFPFLVVGATSNEEDTVSELN